MSVLVLLLTLFFGQSVFSIETVRINVAKEFKIIPKLVNNRVKDLSKSLIVMRDILIRRGPEKHYVLNFPYNSIPYAYSNNNWLKGLKNFTLQTDPRDYPNKAIFKNISKEFGGQDQNPFYISGVFDAFRDEVYFERNQNISLDSGVLLKNSALKNRKSIVVESVDDFHPDQWVLIHGHFQGNKKDSANLRYFEYKKIEYIIGNRIWFRKSLENDFHINWWDQEMGMRKIGKPRLLSLNRGNFSFAERIILKNIKFSPNEKIIFDKRYPKGLVNPTFLSFSALNVTLDGIEGDFPSFNIKVKESEETIIRNSVIGGYIEIGNIVKRILIENNKIKNLSRKKKFSSSITGGESCDRLVIRKNTLLSGINAICKELQIYGNKITSRPENEKNSEREMFFGDDELSGIKFIEYDNESIHDLKQLSKVKKYLKINLSSYELSSDGVTMEKNNLGKKIFGLYPGKFVFNSSYEKIGVFLGFFQGSRNRVLLKFQWGDNFIESDLESLYFKSFQFTHSE